MKRFLLISFLTLFSLNFYAAPLATTKKSPKVQEYVETYLKQFDLNKNLIRQIRKNLEIEFEDFDCGVYPEPKFNERVKEYKKYFLT